MSMSIGGFGGTGYSSGGNVYASMHSKYGCEYPDYADRPRVAPYPMYAIPKAPPRKAHTPWWTELLKRWKL